MTARCPYCSAGILPAQAFCATCGRPLTAAAPGYPPQPGIYQPAPMQPAYAAAAFAPATAPAAQPIKEKRHHWIWLGNLITIGIGGYIIYAHWQGTVGLIVAAALFALAVLSLSLSRFGARWKRATCLEKLLIIPGVLAGLVVLVVILLSGADSDSSSSGHGSSHSTDSHSGSDSHSDNLFDEDGGDSRRRRAPFLSCPRCGQMVMRTMRLCPRCGTPLM